ncbi:MAG: alpha-galactosidase [Candidatus Omnitrophica bacterium]|nr:alpha-galactosidase [Candidatus Omnitrophota bacterium]
MKLPGIAAGFAVIALSCLAVQGAENPPLAEEMEMARNWISANWGPRAVAPPFSFMYGGRASTELLKSWKLERTSQEQELNRTRETITYADPRSGLEIRCVIVRYADFPTVEWTLYFKNAGSADSPILDQVQAMDILLKHGEGGKFLLHHNAGSWPGAASYAPYETPLPRGLYKRIGAYGGRPTNTDLAYFNLEWDHAGMIFAVGWPGQWEAQFQRDDRDGLRLSCGQELTHLTLHPNEEIRTPLMVLQFWKGNWNEAQNVWRRWMIKYNLPRPGGKPVTPMLSGQSGYCTSWMYEATEENQKWFIERFLALGIPIDYWWMDTGWYYTQGVPENQLTDELKALNRAGRLWEKFGVWEVNRGRFPHGIRAISDYAHARGIKTILWFEPERVTPGSWLEKARPEWCLSASTTDQKLLNLGHPDALKWVTDRIHQVLTEEGIDVYRSDFNMDPLDHWRQNDPPDRQGITENHWVTGYLAFWDALLQRNPNLLIDSCASGGRRNDLETMRRSVPLWKCDYALEPVGMQCQTYGLAMWLPYFGNAGGLLDPYLFRCNMFPAITKGAWEDRTDTRDIRRDDLDYDLLRSLIAQWRQVATLFLADYYPLTPYSLDRTGVWIAWQFNSPEKGEGMVQAFRRPGAPSFCQFQLRGLEPDTEYEWTNFDLPGTTKATGRELMEKGVEVYLNNRPNAVLIKYEKTPIQR